MESIIHDFGKIKNPIDRSFRRAKQKVRLGKFSDLIISRTQFDLKYIRTLIKRKSYKN